MVGAGVWLVVERLQYDALLVVDEDKKLFDVLEYIQPQEVGWVEADFYPDYYKYKKSLMLLLLMKQFGLNYGETYLRH